MRRRPSFSPPYLVVYVLVGGLALAAFGLSLSSRMERKRLMIEVAAAANAGTLDAVVKNARDKVRLLQLYAVELLHSSRDNPPPEVYAALQPSPTQRDLTVLDPSLLPQRADTATMLSLHGPPPPPDSGDARELRMMYALSPLLRGVRQSTPAAASVYYVSRRRMSNVYPLARLADQAFQEDWLNRPFFRSATVQANPQRSAFWTEAFVDGPEGLMSSLAAPVDDSDGTFKGVVGLHFALATLSHYVMGPNLDIGVAFLVNNRGQVLAHPKRVSPAVAHPRALSEVMPADMLAQWDRIAALPAGRTATLSGYYVTTWTLNDAPWTYVLTVDRPALALAAARDMWPEALGLLMLVTSLVSIELRRRHELASRQSEATERVFEEAPSPIAVIRQSDRSAQVANQALLQLFRLSSKDREHALPRVAEQLNRCIDRAATFTPRSEAVPIEAPFERSDGSTFHALVKTIPTHYGGAPAWLCSLTDVTALKQAQEQLEALATTDALTGVMNRRAIIARAEVELQRVQRWGVPLSGLILDIDHFKRINDLHGHAIGDRALVALAEACRQALRAVDVFGRWGGEEFVALLPDATLESAREVAERLRALVENLAVLSKDGRPVRFTVSIGVATLTSPGDDLDGLIGRADQALYAAKLSGRNRVVAPPWRDKPTA